MQQSLCQFEMACMSIEGLYLSMALCGLTPLCSHDNTMLVRNLLQLALMS